MSRLTITVTLEDRGDGGLRVWSEALPGLMLSGPDKGAICNAIAPAIKALLEHKGLLVVRIDPEPPITEAIQQPSPRDVVMHVHHENYVVELADAA